MQAKSGPKKWKKGTSVQLKCLFGRGDTARKSWKEESSKEASHSVWASQAIDGIEALSSKVAFSLTLLGAAGILATAPASKVEAMQLVRSPTHEATAPASSSLQRPPKSHKEAQAQWRAKMESMKAAHKAAPELSVQVRDSSARDSLRSVGPSATGAGNQSLFALLSDMVPTALSSLVGAMVGSTATSSKWRKKLGKKVEELEGLIESAESTAETFRERFLSSQQKLALVEGKCGDLEADLAERRAEILASRRNLRLEEKEAQNLTAKISSLKDDLAKAAERENQSERSLADYRFQNEKLKESLSMSQLDGRALHQAAETARKIAAETREILQKECESNKALSGEAARLRDEILKSEKAISILEDSQAEIEVEKEAMLRKMAWTEGKMQTLKKRETQLTSMVADTQSMIANAAARISDVNANAADMASRTKESEQRQNHLSQELDISRSERRELEAKLKAARISVAEKDRMLVQLKKEIRENVLAQQQNELSTKQSGTALQSLFEAERFRSAQIRKELEGLKERCSKAEHTLDSWSQKTTTAKETVANLEIAWQRSKDDVGHAVVVTQDASPRAISKEADSKHRKMLQELLARAQDVTAASTKRLELIRQEAALAKEQLESSLQESSVSRNFIQKQLPHMNRTVSSATEKLEDLIARLGEAKDEITLKREEAQDMRVTLKSMRSEFQTYATEASSLEKLFSRSPTGTKSPSPSLPTLRGGSKRPDEMRPRESVF